MLEFTDHNMAIFHMKFATTKNAGPCLTTLATMRHTTLFASSLHCVRTSFKDHPNYQIMGGIVVKTQEAILSPEQVQFQLLASPRLLQLSNNGAGFSQ